ncbi:hypothetical protein [Dyella sp. GSA-30]|uniref:hypothetical protein n=1 Tax=Dyella sp. GSA-30 TaxID=2994496 RepID=UPI002492609E|nr:hypothetical protein [Dyella sp. GSA-30]BDU19973.1 hypothetical protein DYGSA30_14300 [Dyella sp. GSA-30]
MASLSEMVHLGARLEDRRQPMRSILSNMLLALALAGWVQSAACSESYCATGQVSPIKLRVTIQPGRREDFIKFLQSDKDPIALGASYVGRAETSDSLSIDFLEVFDAKRASKISIQADNKKPSAVFDFSFWSCNTTRSLEPYRDAVRNRVTQFGVGAVSVVDVPSK